MTHTLSQSRGASRVHSPSSEPLFLNPLFVSKVWGGSRLAAYCRTPLPSNTIGECIAISARPESDCAVTQGRYQGHTLSALWEHQRHLFGGVTGDFFPLQVKLLDAHQALSVQVHPDDEYARRHEQDSGKNECWYVLAPSASRQVILGHRARSRTELRTLAQAGRWDELLSTSEMSKGDFISVPAGTAHCLLAGSLVYEVLQASGVTYRLHDFDRAASSGEARELHLERALEVIQVPNNIVSPEQHITHFHNGTETIFIQGPHFTVRKWDVRGRLAFDSDRPFLLASALQGNGYVNGCPVAAGDHFIIPSQPRRVEVCGRLELMISST